MLKKVEFKVYIEMPAGSDPVKYAVKEDEFVVKRILNTNLKYPTNYGYIPKTFAEDGDELDALVITPYPLQHCSRIKCRTIGVVDVDDQDGKDYKIIAIPVTKVYNGYEKWESPNDIPITTFYDIQDFFSHYKDNYTDRWSRVNKWLKRDKAEEIIHASYQRYKDRCAELKQLQSKTTG